MKTKTTKLLVLLMAVVMQGFVSVSWGQDVFTIDSIGEWNYYNELSDEEKDKYTKIEIIYPLVCDVDADIVIETLDLSNSVTEIDGGGNEIIGAKQPLFSSIPQKCTVKNVKVSGSSITYTYTPESPASISPFANVNSGTIKNCSVENCTVTCSSGTGNDSDDKKNIYIGGLAGTNDGIISNCIAKDNKLSIWSGENTTYKLYSGQIAGLNENSNSKINNCFCHISNIDYHLAHVSSVEIKTIDLEANVELDSLYYSKAIVGKTEGGMADNLVLFAVPKSDNADMTQASNLDDITIPEISGCVFVKTYYNTKNCVQNDIVNFLNAEGCSLVRGSMPEYFIIADTWTDMYLYLPDFESTDNKKEKYYGRVVNISSAADWNTFAEKSQLEGVDDLVERINITADLSFTELVTLNKLCSGDTIDGGGFKITGTTKDPDKTEIGSNDRNLGWMIGQNDGIIRNIVIDNLASTVKGDTREEYYSLLCQKNIGSIEQCIVQNSTISTTSTLLETSIYIGCLCGLNEGEVYACYGAGNKLSMSESFGASVYMSQLVGCIDSENKGSIYQSFAVENIDERVDNDKVTYNGFVFCNDADAFKNLGVYGRRLVRSAQNALFYISPEGNTIAEDKIGFSQVVFMPSETSSDIDKEERKDIDGIKMRTVKYSSYKELEDHIKGYVDTCGLGDYAVINTKSWSLDYLEYGTHYSSSYSGNNLDFPRAMYQQGVIKHQDNKYVIESEGDWNELVKNGIFAKENLTIELIGDITFEMSYQTVPSLGKNTVFNGNGHTINIKIVEQVIPLFNEVNEGAIVKNFHIYFCNSIYCSPSFNSSNNNYGLLVSTNNGTIESCGFFVDSEYGCGDVTINGYSEKEDITLNIGLLCGNNTGIINNCFVGMCGQVNISPIYSDNVQTTKMYYGSLVGQTSGTISNCYALLRGLVLPYIDADEGLEGRRGEIKFGKLIGQFGSNSNLQNLFVVSGIVLSTYNINGEIVENIENNYVDADVVDNMYYSEDEYLFDEANQVYKPYGESEVYGPYCFDLPTFIANFSNPMKWRNAQSDTEDDDVYFARYNAPILTFSNLDAVIDEDIKIVDLVLTDTTEVAEFTEALKNNPEVYSNAIVTLGNDIDYSNDEADADVPETLPSFNQLGGGDVPFNGTFDGSGYSIKNMIVRSDSNGSGGFFKNISESAVVKNLNIEGANIFVMNVDSMMTYSNGDENFEGVDTIYVAVFADKNKGMMSNCSFVGSIKVDEAIANSGKVIKVCFVGENEESEGSEDVVLDHAFIYLTDDTQEQQAADGNKVCIVIKQHIGAGRKSGRTRKTCSNKKSNKALVINPSKDEEDAVGSAVVNSEYREYTDEEFARGDVAFWLNYTQKGFTGEYSGEWKQGELYPVLDLDKTSPLVKLVYSLEGVDDKTGFKYPPYGNIGSTATIEYQDKPTSVSVNGKAVSPSAIGATSTSFEIPDIDYEKEPIVNVEVVYSDLTPIADDKDMTTKVTSEGNKIVISGASGETVSVVSLRGVKMLDTEVSTDDYTVVIPQSGIYVVKVGEMTQKVVIK